MSISEKDYADHLLKLYEGQTTHGRHHEVMRAQATNYILVVSAAVIGLASSSDGVLKGLDVSDRLLLGMVVVLINAYGAVLSLKHYERSRACSEVGSAYRQALAAIHQANNFKPTETIRAEAHVLIASRRSVVGRLRLHWLWPLLHVILAGIGIARFWVI